jgi:glycosyltransferase involved in cell wall biosynthesis
MVLQVIPFLDAKYGGPVATCLSMYKYFKINNIDNRILTTNTECCHENKDIVRYKKTTETWFFSFDLLMNGWRDIKDVDVVLVHGFYSFFTLYAVFVSSVFKKKLFLRPAGMLDRDSIGNGPPLKIILRKLYIYMIGVLLVNSSSNIIFNSSKEKKSSIYGQLKKSLIIVNGTDFDSVKECNNIDKYFAVGKLNLLFLGRIHEIKGIKKLLESFNNLPSDIKNKVDFVVAGTGCKKYCDSMVVINSQVRFVGQITDKDKYMCLNEADIYIQPSVTEGLSNSMMEALSCNTAVIITSTSGMSEELRKGNAAVVVDYDVTSISMALLNLIESEKKINFYKTSGYQFAKSNFDWSNNIKHYIDLMC